MEDKKANIIAISSVTVLVILIITARISLQLSETFFLICGASVAAILAIFAFIIIRRRFNRRRKLLETQIASEGRELRVEFSFLRKVAGLPTKFRHKELEKATNGFQALIGRGASASVFKGILSDGTLVAVKRIEGEERGEREFKSEVAAIASVQHVNLVRLLGFCSAPTRFKFLVYEFISNGSLDNWIFPQILNQNLNTRCGCLSWDLRRRVAIDVAKALCYLHHDCRSRVLHLDVKPQNILLDDKFHGFVADFGLSKLMKKEESRVFTNIRGTIGYLAPEWLLENGVSEKCDIYSYGMVLLEIIGGRRNVSVSEDANHDKKSKRKFEYFPKIVIEKLKEGKIMDVVDSRLVEGGRIEESEVKRFVCVALWCIQEKARLRPSMVQVVDMLEGLLTVEEPPESKMIVVDLLSIDEEPTPGHHNHRIAAREGPQVDSMSNVPSSSTYSYSMSVLSGR